jgi:hypothetical protein
MVGGPWLLVRSEVVELALGAGKEEGLLDYKKEVAKQ